MAVLGELTAIDLEETSRALSVLGLIFQLGRGTAILVWRGPWGVFFLKITSLSVGLGLLTLKDDFFMNSKLVTVCNYVNSLRSAWFFDYKLCVGGFFFQMTDVFVRVRL